MVASFAGTFACLVVVAVASSVVPASVVEFAAAAAGGVAREKALTMRETNPQYSTAVGVVELAAAIVAETVGFQKYPIAAATFGEAVASSFVEIGGTAVAVAAVAGTVETAAADAAYSTAVASFVHTGWCSWFEVAVAVVSLLLRKSQHQRLRMHQIWTTHCLCQHCYCCYY